MYINDLIDIIKGEKLAYCDSIIVRLRKRFPNQRLAVIYDIICNEVAHIQKCGDDELQLPYWAVMDALHSYCHDINCQSRFAIKDVFGLGTLSGVELEQEWSRLNRFVTSTRLMTAGNRQLDLSLKFESLDQQAVRNIAENLHRKLLKALAVLADLELQFGPVTLRNRGKYSDVVKENNFQRRIRHTPSTNQLPIAKRDKIGELQRIQYQAGIIRSLERLVKS